VVAGQVLQQHVGVAVDDGEQVIEVVGDAAGEPAQALHLLRLADLLAKLLFVAFGDLASGDVADEDDRAVLAIDLHGRGRSLHLDLAAVQAQHHLLARRRSPAFVIEEADPLLHRVAMIGGDEIKHPPAQHLARVERGEETQRGGIEIAEAAAGLNEDGLRRALHQQFEAFAAGAQVKMRGAHAGFGARQQPVEQGAGGEDEEDALVGVKGGHVQDLVGQVVAAENPGPRQEHVNQGDARRAQ
jgi:hypothetical protein